MIHHGIYSLHEQATIRADVAVMHNQMDGVLDKMGVEQSRRLLELKFFRDITTDQRRNFFEHVAGIPKEVVDEACMLAHQKLLLKHVLDRGMWKLVAGYIKEHA